MCFQIINFFFFFFLHLENSSLYTWIQSVSAPQNKYKVTDFVSGSLLLILKPLHFTWEICSSLTNVKVTLSCKNHYIEVVICFRILANGGLRVIHNVTPSCPNLSVWHCFLFSFRLGLCSKVILFWSKWQKYNSQSFTNSPQGGRQS